MFLPAHRSAAALAAASLFLGAGCADRSVNRYAPPEAAARQALEAALTAWQNGQSPGEITSESAKVQAVDSRWQAGDKLGGFEVLDEGASEDGTATKVFSVRLDMKKPAARKTVRYYVVGIDPLWVYREDDYKAPAGM